MPSSISSVTVKRRGARGSSRKQIMTLPPDISNDEAELLLRISAIQAIYNARAYCRNFDTLTGPQQMALAHMVYQIGINLVHFDKFLEMVNADQAGSPGLELAALESTGPDAEYWTSVQKSLMQSQWARHYRNRAITVIAMLDPRYDNSPTAAERRVSAVAVPRCPSSPEPHRHNTPCCEKHRPWQGRKEAFHTEQDQAAGLVEIFRLGNELAEHRPRPTATSPKTRLPIAYRAETAKAPARRLDRVSHS